ncbi:MULTISPECIES: AI-2E family transporter [Halomonadaceae]|uniref:AI-2E family transporter n=1 Tax=Modicisalibacter zincidurans TaxID=1178777 RepID=A0ABP9RES2_9GAMM|nr:MULTISPECIES: AI-2E family transporter [Halomonas]MCD6008816.1 AI-2E family transporter [Halomonas sp. IOP_31]
MAANSERLRDYTRKVWIAAGVAAATVAILATLWFGFEILLMVFVGLLLALAFSLPAGWLCRHSFLSRRWALLVVLLVISGLLAAFSVNFAFSIGQQFEQLAETLPGSLVELKTMLSQWPMGSQIIEWISENPSPDANLSSWSTRVSTVFSTTFGALLNVVVVVFIGLFIAFDPGIYRTGLIKLITPAHREGAAVVLEAIKHKLAWWLLGRLASMTAVGLLAGVGLWALGIPMALSLGLLAALLSFIPYLGPLFSAVPALLVAFSVDSTAMLHVAVLYTGVQTLESYLVTPLIQREAVSIPPGLLLIVQVWLGLVAGLLGMLVAEPLIVLGMILVQRVYVKGWLERQDPPVEQAPEPTAGGDVRR